MSVESALAGPQSRRREEKAPAGPQPPFLVAFRFEPKSERTLPPDELEAELDSGAFVWLDLDLRHPDASALLARLAIDPEILDEAETGDPATQVARYERSLHVALTACRLHHERFDLDRVDVIVAERFLVTLHRSSPHFVRLTRRNYRDDFLRFARSPSFLLYELWDHLIEDYLSVQKKFEERVEKVQSELTQNPDDGVFGKISALGSDLLHFRKVLLPARSVLSELSTRKSPFISEATQPYLANMIGTIERVLQDLLVDRDILSESLNLYMSFVGHRTNRVMNRLTVVSVIFLPLTFLCGVYGMNFEILPETKWEYGYLFFWSLALAIVVALVLYMRKKELL
jgi:magnesium transporter